RCFAPAHGINEDPVTGSAHCTLIPFWAARLGKTKLRARQISMRVGDLYCEHRGERVTIAGKAAFYMQGAIEV
ncbi:MAG: PhzF family phenazine biosynthesis protein, partial [Acidobacteriota bacterium]